MAILFSFGSCNNGCCLTVGLVTFAHLGCQLCVFLLICSLEASMTPQFQIYQEISSHYNS